MAANQGGRPARLSRRLTVCVLAPAVLLLVVAALAVDGFSRLGASAGRASSDGVAALSPAVRLMHAADGLGAAALRLLWADSRHVRAAARTDAEVHGDVIADYLAADAAANPAARRQIAAALARLNGVIAAADRLAERRIEALAALPSARERLVVQVAGLDALLSARRGDLNALPRFHPDTQKELLRHDEWRRVSTSLLSALLLTVNAGDGDGGGGAVGAATAHLTRLTQIAAAFPDSDFAVAVGERQNDIAAAVAGPQGVLTQLAALRTAQDEAAALAVDGRRFAIDLAQAGVDHVEAARAEVDARLFEIGAAAGERRLHVAAAALLGLSAAALGVAYVRHRVGRRLGRLLVALEDDFTADGDRLDAVAAGNDDIAALARAARNLTAEVKRREAALTEDRIRFELAAEAGDAAVWDENLAEGRIWWSPGYYRLLGYDADEITPTVGMWEMLVHPDDRAAAAEAAERCLAGMSDRYAAVYRLRRKDGSWTWVEDHGGVQRDADGLAVRFVGMMRDVTRRRSAEIRMRRAKDAADAAARRGGDLLTAAERRLRPGLRRLTAKLSLLETWALTDEQRRMVAEVKNDAGDVLEVLAELGRTAAERDGGGKEESGQEGGAPAP